MNLKTASDEINLCYRTPTLHKKKKVNDEVKFVSLNLKNNKLFIK